MKKFNSNILGGGRDCSGDGQFFFLAKPLSALCCVKEFDRNSFGGGVVLWKGALYLSGLCCVRIFTSSTYGDFLLLKYVRNSLQLVMDE